MHSVEQAIEEIRGAVRTLPPETMLLSAAAGRLLAATVESQVNLPGFDNSAMDGYAVRSEDVRSASEDSPFPLKIIGEIPAGVAFDGVVGEGECARIFTGSPMPEGADAVVMQEDTERDGDTVKILDLARPLENVRLRGEDVKLGEAIGRAGDRVNAGMLNLLSAAGCHEVTVHGRPVIGLLATGDELKTPPVPLAPGQIYESNRVMLAAMVEHAGCEARVYELVPDQPDATSRAIENAFEDCHAVITTGGVSVGEHDYVKAAFEALGGRLDFWKVRVKPGKPFVFGQLGSRLLFGLPGNPVSAFATFVVLVRPALLTWQGANDSDLPTHPGVLGETLSNRGDRPHYVRVHVDANGTVRSAGVQASHMLHSLAHANGLVAVPPETSWESGRSVSVMRFDF